MQPWDKDYFELKTVEEKTDSIKALSLNLSKRRTEVCATRKDRSHPAGQRQTLISPGMALEEFTCKLYRLALTFHLFSRILTFPQLSAPRNSNSLFCPVPSLENILLFC